MKEQKGKLQSEQNGLDDLLDELSVARKSHVELVTRQGELQAAVKVCSCKSNFSHMLY